MSNNNMKVNISARKQNKLNVSTETDCDKCGWLKKQGGTFKTMKRRYFVLVNEVLYYFTNNTRNTLKGQINLRNLELSELEEDRGSGEYSFCILPELGKDCVNGTHERFQLVSYEKVDAESWLQHLKQNMYLQRDGGLFHTALDTVRKYLKPEYSYVPRLVFECCQRIREIGMDEEGIFRKNGQQSLVYQMRCSVDRANYNWEGVDIHTICSLLKLYLRELPEPLIPFSHYDSLKAVGYRIDVGEDLDLVRNKLRVLPPANLQLLKYLCEFLQEVSTHPKNRMEIESLAKVFSPNILRDQDTDPYIEESSSSLLSITVAAFIKSQRDLFIFEYEPLKNENRDSVNDDDTYSVTSVLAHMNFFAACLNFDDHNGSTVSLPHHNHKPERVQSMAISNYQCCNDLLAATTFSQSTDELAKLKPSKVHGEYVELTPFLSSKPLTEIKGDKTKNTEKSTNVCENCLSLKQQLRSVIEERNQLQELCNIKTEMCLQRQKDIDVLRLELSGSVKSRSEDSSDLSEVLAYFKMK